MKIYFYVLLFTSLISGTMANGQTVNLTAVADNTLYEDPTGQLSNGAGDGMFAGATGGGSMRRSVLRFNLSTIPGGATITAVTLQLYVTQTVAPATNVDIHTVTQNWGEGTSLATGGGGGGAQAQTNDATWIHTFFNGLTWTNAGGDFNPVPSASTSVGGIQFYNWSSAQMVTDVQNWFDNPSTNFGWIVIGDESTSTTAKKFATREHFNASFHPTLTVTYTVPCIDPVITSFTATSTSVCPGTNIQLTTSGSLNNATSWQLYSGSCGSTPLVTNTSGIFNVTPSSTTDYFVRGIGGCVTPGACSTLTVTVLPTDDPSFSYAGPVYCNNATNILPTITGTSGGTFTALPGGLSVNSSTGEIDFNASTANTYNVTYTTAGPNCPTSQGFTLTIHPAFTTNTSATICAGDSYTLGSQILDTAGVYNELFSSEFGCDSTVTLTLSINAVDTSVTLTGFTLAADSAGTYQWLDCDNSMAIIPGETNQQYSPANNGHYAVIVTQNGCSDTSNCHFVNGIGLYEHQWQNNIHVFPNPAVDNITVTSPVTMMQVTLHTVSGEMCLRQLTSSSRLVMDIHKVPAGLYFLEIKTNQGTAIKKITVQ